MLNVTVRRLSVRSDTVVALQSNGMSRPRNTHHREVAPQMVWYSREEISTNVQYPGAQKTVFTRIKT